MKDLSECTLPELMAMASNKKNSSEEAASISLELERRQAIAVEKERQRKLAKEIEMSQRMSEAEEEAARQAAQKEEHERFLLTEEGRQWAEQERQRFDQERIRAEDERIAREAREAIEAKERYEREAAEEAARKQKEIDDLEHAEQLQEDYSIEDIAKIKEREKILGRKLKHNEIPYKSKAHQHCAAVDVIDSRNHPDYGTIERFYSRHLTTPAEQQDLYLRSFMHKFKEKFRTQNTNNNAITNNNVQMPLMPPGSNHNDLAIAHVREGTELFKAGKEFFSMAFEKNQANNTLLLTIIDRQNEHIRKLEKQGDKHEEKMEKVKVQRDKAEISKLKLRRNYLKKHPYVAFAEGAGKAVEGIGNAVVKMFASDEDRAKIEKEEAEKKARKKIAKDEAIQEAIAAGVKAELLRRGIKDE